MNYELLDLFNSWVAFCLSFTIIVLISLIKDKQNDFRYTSLILLTPMIINGIIVFHDIPHKFDSIATVQLILSDLGLITLFFLRSFKKVSQNNIFYIIALLNPALLYRLSIQFSSITTPSFTLGIISASVFSLSCLLVIMRSKCNRTPLYYGLFLLAVCLPIKVFLQTGTGPALHSFLHATAFLMIFIHYYIQTKKIITDKIQQADKIISDFNMALKNEIKKKTFEIEKHNNKLLEKSKKDTLTDTYNKTALLNIIETYIHTGKYKEFSVLMFDIDNFKSINDTYGHITGDKCIMKLASIATESIREEDCVGRYGGDEFIIILPELTTQESFFIGERLRKNVMNSSSPQFTISIGISSFPQDGSTVQQIISVADEGLYLSKKKGRNAISHKSFYANHPK
ncbi:GGDEF domain-containing protein [Petroclostridium sp. X23]|uniref:GGDEF domain-containing protein n=1 Tax=Petroclostridium sp. X23 TaxID=3045146 RepID=UPI0024AD89FF|nr:GGDEF domain-containing protein [Petroclostridium sp. X23]WHH57893.1 GGDEF domain-containing protein [Petroclostridium sp. X23]